MRGGAHHRPAEERGAELVMAEQNSVSLHMSSGGVNTFSSVDIRSV